VIGLLRADLIRLRGRLDLWVVGFAVPVLAAFGYLRGYYDVPNHFGFDPQFPVPPDVVAQIAAERSQYAFPFSLVGLLDSVPWVFVAVFFMTAMTIGSEYGSGTIRTALLASTDRHRFLASRSVALGIVGAAIIAVLLVLAVVLPALLGLLGAAILAPPPISAPDYGLALVARLLILAFVVALAALLTVVTRNPALPLLLVLIYFLFEGIVTSMPLFHDPSGLTWLPGLLPLKSVSDLLSDTLRTIVPLDPSVVAGQLDQPGTVVFPLWLAFAVVAGWFGLLYLAADRFFQGSDIRE
jgi:ABC-2 type transport system permease protein